MRLKSYAAASMTEAMALIRDEIGDDALIVSSQRDGRTGQVRVMAAVDAPSEMLPFAASGEAAAPPADLGAIVVALNAHGVPAGVMDKLLDSAWQTGTEDGVMALASALDRHYRFAPLRHHADERPLMLVGPHGVGKSLTVAKLAAACVLDRRDVVVTTTDTVRAGGIEQLAAIARVLEIEVEVADGPGTLAETVRRRRPSARVLIDTPGISWLDGEAIAGLAASANGCGAEPVLVMAAGTDPQEAAEIATVFMAIGAVRMVATRLDSSRRLGAVLAAASEGLAFSEASLRPQVANGLHHLNPVGLARLIMGDDGRRQADTAVAEAVA